MKPYVSGMCDCGDPEAWKKEGNCSKHSGFNDKVAPLPKDIEQELTASVKLGFYYIL
jgi:Putative zinc finger in N-recognin (UBR box)